MKKLINASVFAAVLMASSAVLAGFNGATASGKGGFQGPGVETISVVEALKLSDDTPVVLNGKIEKSLGDEKYLFNDGTATVIIEIDDDDWGGLNVTPEDVVVISGEVDKGMLKGVEIDVDTIQLKK